MENDDKDGKRYSKTQKWTLREPFMRYTLTVPAQASISISVIPQVNETPMVMINVEAPSDEGQQQWELFAVMVASREGIELNMNGLLKISGCELLGETPPVGCKVTGSWARTYPYEAYHHHVIAVCKDPARAQNIADAIQPLTLAEYQKDRQNHERVSWVYKQIERSESNAAMNAFRYNSERTPPRTEHGGRKYNVKGL